MLCNQSSRFYCDADEIAGLMRLLMDEQTIREDAEERAALSGAAATLEILSTQQLRYPRDFMAVFKSMLFYEYAKETDKEQEN